MYVDTIGDAENVGDGIDACTEIPNLEFAEFSKNLRFELSSPYLSDFDCNTPGCLRKN